MANSKKQQTQVTQQMQIIRFVNNQGHPECSFKMLRIIQVRKNHRNYTYLLENTMINEAIYNLHFTLYYICRYLKS